MMNQYIFYPNQRQQILARLLLTIWFPVICSPEATFAAPKSGKTAPAASSVDATPSSSSGLRGERQQIRNVAVEKALRAAAAQGKRVKVIKILSKSKIDINAVDEQGQSALHQAVITGYKEVAALLISYGADKELQDHQGKTPLDYAKDADRGYLSAIGAKIAPAASTSSVDATASSSSGLRGERQQTRNVAAEKALRAAAAEGKLLKVKSILAKEEIDINATDEQGQSALHRAIIAGHTKIAVLLIKQGADVALKDQENKTPLDYAGADDKYFSTIGDLVKLFLDIDGLIESGSIQKQAAIAPKLDEVCIWLTKLEVKEPQDQKQYQYFKHRYHIQNARYLEALGETLEAAQHRELAEEYKDQEPSPRDIDPAEQEELEAEIAARAEGAGTTGAAAAHMQQHVNKIIAQGILPEDTCNQIKSVIAIAEQGLSNLISYCKASRAREQFKALRSNFLQEYDDSSQIPNEDTQQKIDKVKELLVILDQQVSAAIDGNRLAFIKSTVALSDHIQHIFFANVLSIEEEINRRYQALVCQFDPTSATWIPAAYRQDAHTLMHLITFCKDELLQAPISAARCKKRGDIEWNAYMKYWYVQNGQNDRITKLTKKKLNQLSPDELEASKLATAQKAYRYYRAGSRRVPTDDRKSQVQFRSSMALCLNALGKPLAAHLYALAAVKLTENHADDSNITPEDKAEAQEILQKIKVGNPTSHGSRPASTEPLDEESAMLAHLEGLAGNVIFKSNQGLARYQSSEDEISQANNQVWRYGVSAIASGGGGFTGTVIVSSLFEAILPAAAAGPSILPFIGFVATVAPFALGIWGAVYLANQGDALQQKIRARQEFNSIIAKAVERYNQGIMHEFLNQLSAPYGGRQLFSIAEVKKGINLNNIMQSLMQGGIRPDGVAYLLNLMGEAFHSGKVSIQGCDAERLAKQGEESFQGTLDAHLVQSANCLDNRVSEIRKEIMANARKHYSYEFTDFWLLHEKATKGYLAKDHLEDAQEMPFRVRLETMRNVARMNIAMMYIVNSKSEEIKKVKGIANAIQDSVKRYGQFYTPIAKYLAAIKEIVFIVSGEEIDPAPRAAPNLQQAKEASGDADLNQRKEKLKQAKSDEDRVKIYNQVAAYYVQQAQKKAKINHLDSLQDWQEAQTNYESALQLMRYDQTASLGYARCLVGLSKYNRALRYCKEHPNINDMPEFWLMASIAYRKQFDYRKAKECILEALQRDCYNKEIIREKALIDKLQPKGKAKRRAEPKKTQLQYEAPYLDVRRSGDKQHYTILSIDGGGVRGGYACLVAKRD